MGLSSHFEERLQMSVRRGLLCLVALLATTCGSKRDSNSMSTPDGATPESETWQAPKDGVTPDGNFDVVEITETRDSHQDPAFAISLKPRGGLIDDGAWLFYECSSKQVGSSLNDAACGGVAIKDLAFSVVTSQTSLQLTEGASSKEASVEGIITPGSPVKFGKINSGSSSRNGGVVVKLPVTNEQNVTAVVARKDGKASSSASVKASPNSSKRPPTSPSDSGGSCSIQCSPDCNGLEVKPQYAEIATPICMDEARKVAVLKNDKENKFAKRDALESNLKTLERKIADAESTLRAAQALTANFKSAIYDKACNGFREGGRDYPICMDEENMSVNPPPNFGKLGYELVDALKPGLDCSPASVIGYWVNLKLDDSPQSVCHVGTQTVKGLTGVDVTWLRVNEECKIDKNKTTRQVVAKCLNSLYGPAGEFTVICPRILSTKLFKCRIWNPGQITYDIALAFGSFFIDAGRPCVSPKKWHTSSSVCGSGGIMPNAYLALLQNEGDIKSVLDSATAELEPLKTIVEEARKEAARALGAIQSANQELADCLRPFDISTKERKELVKELAESCNRICKPYEPAGTKSCEGPEGASGTQTKTCNSKGTDYDLGPCIICKPNESAGTASCEYHYAPTNETFRGVRTKTCNTTGTDFNFGDCKFCNANESMGEEPCTVANGVGSRAKMCNSSGTGFSYDTECKVTRCNDGYILNGGQCVEKICTPNESVETGPCSVPNGTGTKTKTCNSNGTGFNPEEICKATSCNDGYTLNEGHCVAKQICTPNEASEQFCGSFIQTPLGIKRGSQTKTCNTDGTKFEFGPCQICKPNESSGTQACSMASDWLGQSGTQTVTCNADGSGFDLGPCQICKPNESAGTQACSLPSDWFGKSGSQTKTCNSSGTGFDLGPCSSSSSSSSSAEYCVPYAGNNNDIPFWKENYGSLAECQYYECYQGSPHCLWCVPPGSGQGLSPCN